jgi:hypothetical protein
METLLFLGNNNCPTAIITAEGPNEGRKIYDAFVKSLGKEPVHDIDIVPMDPGQMIVVSPNSPNGVHVVPPLLILKPIPIRRKPDVVLTPI